MVDQHFISKKSDVEKFLKELKSIIYNENLDKNKQFFLLSRKNDLSTSMYANYNTLLLLNYNIDDIIKELSSLEYENYYETIIDSFGYEKLLYVFKKRKDNIIIYIKLSINNRIIKCVSFHISNEK